MARPQVVQTQASVAPSLEARLAPAGRSRAACIRGRTNQELDGLIRRQQNLDLSGWEFKAGETTVLPPFGVMYWYMGVKKPQQNEILDS